MNNALSLSQLLRLGLSLQAQVSSKAIERKIGKGLATAALMLVSALFVFGAFILCLAALWLYLKPMFGAVFACLLVAGLLIVLALFLALIARRSKHIKRPVSNSQPALLLTALDVEKSIKKQKPLFLIAALMTGALAANRK